MSLISNDPLSHSLAHKQQRRNDFAYTHGPLGAWLRECGPERAVIGRHIGNAIFIRLSDSQLSTVA